MFWFYSTFCDRRNSESIRWKLCVNIYEVRYYTWCCYKQKLTKYWPGLGKKCGWTSGGQDVIRAYLSNPCLLWCIMCSHVGKCNRKSVVKLVFLFSACLFSCLPVIQSLSVSDLYPFGRFTSDNKTARDDDGGSHKILLKNPFKFFGRNKSSLFVSICLCLGAFGV